MAIQQPVEGQTTVLPRPTETPVTRGQPLRRGTQVVVGSVRVADLAPRYEIPRRNFLAKTGYQREASPTRVNQLVRELDAGDVDLPTALLVNIRDFDKNRNLVEIGDQIFLSLRDERIYVVDGQHRIEALMRLYLKRDVPDEKWGDFRLSVTFMLGATELEEMEQFYVVNSTAKSVRTDLAYDLLKQRAESNPDLIRSLDENNQSWKVAGQTLSEELAKTAVWKDRIRFAGQPKGDTTIGSAAIVNSLQPLLATTFFDMITTPNQVAVIDAYWRGIRTVLPECFDEPERFTIQKSLGVQVLHTLLVNVLEAVKSTGRSVTDPDVFADALRQPLLILEGETRDGDPARGPDFWLAGPDGAAGQYASNAGRRVLMARIRRTLPRITLD